jgi:outer membrane protein assembly factor BamB
VIPNPNSAVVWHYEKFDIDGDGEIDFEEEMHRTIGSPTIKNDLLFIADFSGIVHCIDAKTGKPYWTCDLLAASWSTPLIVEDKVLIGDEDGEVAIFRLSSDPKKSVKMKAKQNDWYEPLHEVSMRNSVHMMPIVADNVLFIATKNQLFAIETQPE